MHAHDVLQKTGCHFNENIVTVVACITVVADCLQIAWHSYFHVWV